MYNYVYNTRKLRMRTNIDLDEQLVEQAFKLTGLRTKKELVNFALAQLVENKSHKDLLDLAGEIEFDEKYSIDTVRTNRYVID